MEQPNVIVLLVNCNKKLGFKPIPDCASVDPSWHRNLSDQ